MDVIAEAKSSNKITLTEAKRNEKNHQTAQQ